MTTALLGTIVRHTYVEQVRTRGFLLRRVLLRKQKHTDYMIAIVVSCTEFRHATGIAICGGRCNWDSHTCQGRGILYQ